MGNKGVKGRVVFAGTNNGIANLVVTAVDFDPFFNEDDLLDSGKTDAQGNFELTYSHEDFTFWDPHRPPDVVVRVFGPPYADAALFGTRLLHETKEVNDVEDEILDVGVIKIHPDNIDGWLVTNATLNPESGTPVSVFPDTELDWLVDGAALFPKITEAAVRATKSINLMNLKFDVSKSTDTLPKSSGVITKFRSTFNPTNPPSNGCSEGIETRLEVPLRSKGQGGMPVNVMVADIPLTASDSATEIQEFFQGSVATAGYKKGLAILHGRTIVEDGVRAIVIGSSLKQGYFNDERHAIRDARHGGSLIHDVHVAVSGLAVAQIDKTFSTIWKATGKPLVTTPPGPFPDTPPDKRSSVQVLRTLPGTFKARGPQDEDLPHGETGILEAYQRAIINAERFIYFENQYFTSSDIVDVLIERMKDASKPKLQIIMVLNFRPDLPGYPDQQVDNVNKVKAAAESNGHQVGVFTLWSRAEKSGSGGASGQPVFEIMPIYVHSKVAIIDDRWATVGSANLDGTSMNCHEIGLIASGAIFDKLMAKFGLNENFEQFLWEAYWYFVFFIFKEIFFSLSTVLMIFKFAFELVTDFHGTLEKIRETLGDIADVPGLVRDALTRPAQHALPNRSRQPMRNLELNLVIYNGIAGQSETTVIKQLRNQLWTEHLGLESLPVEMQDVPPPGSMDWVKTWTDRAGVNLGAIKNKEAPDASHPLKILRWTGDTTAKDYFRELKIPTKNLRDSAEKFDFSECKFDHRIKGFGWPV